MSGVDLAGAVVGLVAQAGSAAVAGAGGAVGGMAVELVRGRLRGVDQGPEALEAVEQAPDDADARDRLREKLAGVLAEDPAFAAYLASLLAPPKPAHPPTNIGSIHIDRSARARGTFVLGDQAVTRIRKGDPAALLALVAVVVVLALAIYGLAGLTGGDEGEGGWSGSGSEGRVAVLSDPEVVKAAAPDLHSMPAGWALASEPSLTSGSGACEFLATSCDGILHVARSSFDGPSSQSVNFGVVACASADDAGRVYAELISEPQGNTEAKPLAVPALGQESAAFEVSRRMGQALARVGTTVVWAEEEGNGGSDFKVELLEKFLRLVAARAQEAQDGRAPGASAG
ncbi:hypothetical protein [Streptomyces sp. NPDC057854]|uniref:hypothetical protein n=1 Tax=unclassified Streptomyces TaxID=2593676 RepID=UPI0036AE826C